MKKAFFVLCSAFLAPLASLQAQSTYAPAYSFTTFAGLPSGAGSTDGTGSAVRFDHPASLAVDASGNVYVADTNNNTIRKITAAGTVSTFAGTAGISGSADGTGSAARFSSPNGVTVDSAGNLYVADTNNSTIRKITSAGVVTTLAGTAGSPGTADGTGSAARFFSPFGVAVDSAGNVWVADTYGDTIRKITSAGVVTTFAGTASTPGSVDGTGSAARFNFPTGITVDAAGNLYVTDTFNSTIRKITSAGVVTTFAGSAGLVGSTDGTGSAARFNYPFSVAVDGSGNLSVADSYNHTIRRITAGGVVTTFAGSAGINGSADGTGAAARFYSPVGVAVDAAGNTYVSDTTNDTIRKITSSGVVSTLAGAPVYTSADGMGAAARFTFPFDVAVDPAGNIYVADAGNNTIRKVTPSGNVTTLAGLAGVVGSTDGTGSAARFNYPVGVAVDAAGNVFVADAGNNTVRRITPAGAVTTLAGLAGSPGSTDGTGSAARFNYPSDVTVDSAGNVYVADAANNTIRKITAGGVVTTLAGTAGTTGSTDATGAAARFNYPAGLAVNGAGTLYVTDAGNHTIRQISSGGVVTTLAGTASAVGSTDGTGSAARFNSPRGITLDTAGNLFVADFHNFTIRKVLSTGVVTTVGGLAGSLGLADGTGSAARFDYPSGVAVDAAGLLYVSDYGNNTLRVGVIATPAVTGDMNGDGKPDIVWENTTTGDRGFWLMNGTTFSSWVDVGVIATALHIVGQGDFNGDGLTDLLWENSSTGKRVIWFMNGTTFGSAFNLGVLSTDWHIVAAADFNADGKPDILFENTVTGERYLWFMNGSAYVSGQSLGTVSTDWHIAAVADFNGDGMPDFLWENTVTGDRGFWLMNGTTLASWVDIGVVSTDWRIAAAGDFNADGHPDILWQNTVSGDRCFWLMNDTAFLSWVDLGVVSTVWHIAN